MDVTTSPARVREACDRARAGGRTVGFVPTMGALHAGHRALMHRARQECGFVVASVFVNTLQFGPGEDLSAYPRPLDADLEAMGVSGVDLAFTPNESDMYPNGVPTVTVDPGPMGDRLEGASRPGHFRGVLTVVAKLFGLVGPSRAYFGEKDAQQLALVTRMVADLDLPVTVVPVGTVREPHGLAVSSRNAFLGPDERLAAPALFDALSEAAALVRHGERDAHVLKAAMARRIGAEAVARLDYVEVVDDSTWEVLAAIDRPARALVAARIGRTRLIDNLRLPWEPSP